MVEADGRRALVNRAGPKLDLVVIDAFSSDSIPAHLLTLEAFEAARSQLAPGGYIVFHTSNRYFDVDRVVSANSNHLGWAHELKVGKMDDLGTSASRWVIVRPPATAPPSRCLVNLFSDNEPAGETKPVWTDDFSNPLRVLRADGLLKRLTGTR